MVRAYERATDVRPRKGWPKLKPCLGWCGRMHNAKHPGDRFCEDCRGRKERYTGGLDYAGMVERSGPKTARRPD